MSCEKFASANQKHYPDLGSASDCLCRMRNLLQPIRSTTQIWIVTRHQHGISALVSQTSFHGESGGGFGGCFLRLAVTLQIEKIKWIFYQHNPLPKLESLSCLWNSTFVVFLDLWSSCLLSFKNKDINNNYLQILNALNLQVAPYPTCINNYNDVSSSYYLRSGRRIQYIKSTSLFKTSIK